METSQREIEPEMAKRGRKSGKLLQKKQPQRGLGVAQLEKLRLQEQWKMMMIDNIDQIQTPHQKHQIPLQIPLTFLHHLHYGTFINGGQSRNIFHPYMCENGRFVINNESNVQAVFSDLIEVNHEESRFQYLNLLESAKELTSTQKSDYCEICFQKDRFNEEVLGFNEERLKLTLGFNRTIDGEEINNDNGYSRINNTHEEVKVVGVQKNRKSMVEGSVLREYEFFPSKSSTNPNNSSVPAEAIERAVLGETASPSNTNFLDLSLKLSC